MSPGTSSLGKAAAASLSRTRLPAVPPHALPSRVGRGHSGQPSLFPLKPSAGRQTQLLFVFVRQAEGLSVPGTAPAENG